MRLILSRHAKEDLLEIWEFIADHDEIAADRYIDHLTRINHQKKI
jgi:plasmid stabilization system protein ParE